MPTQQPAAQHAVGGQTAITDWDTISQTDGFQEDAENTQNADGTHRCKIVFSRRATKDLELQAQSGATDTFTAGGTLVIGEANFNIESATVRKTRGPMIANVSVIAEADSIT